MEEIAAIAAAMWEHRRSSIVDRPSSIVEEPAPASRDAPSPTMRRSGHRPFPIDDRRWTIDDRYGLNARAWNRCDERRRHRERPSVEGGARAGRTGRHVHRHDQREEPRGRRVVDRRRHAVAHRWRRGARDSAAPARRQRCGRCGVRGQVIRGGGVEAKTGNRRDGAPVRRVRQVQQVRSGALGAASIKAPMPGRVVRVLVTAGDHVTAKQPVVVVEAMKMENELRTPRDGVVTEVRVSAGVTVESGAVLVVIE